MGIKQVLCDAIWHKNAPAVFQHLMQNVLRDLKSVNEKNFVDVCLNDIIIFSESLDGHMICFASF